MKNKPINAKSVNRAPTGGKILKQIGVAAKGIKKDTGAYECQWFLISLTIYAFLNPNFSGVIGRSRTRLPVAL